MLNMAYGKGKSMKLGRKSGGATRGSGGVRTPFNDRVVSLGKKGR